jgi:fumarate reductase flavoprotein subunit
MISQGIGFVAEAPGDIATVLAPVRHLDDLRAWRDRGPHLALQRLQASASRAGAEIVGATNATELLIEDGGICGVRTAQGRSIYARSVVLADGGFGANKQMLREYVGPAADKMFLRAAPSAKGTALQMARAVGARLSNMTWVYGHCMHRDVFQNERLWPWPALDEVMAAGAVLVGADGERLVDESKGGILAVNVLARLRDPMSAWVVVDQELWDSMRGEELWAHLPSNPELERRGARIVHADGAADLAAQAQLDPMRLRNTLESYTAAARAGHGGSLKIPRSETLHRMDGRLVAFPVAPGISETMGGPLTDASTRVLDGEMRPIAGLLAIGSAAAAPTGGYVGGLAMGLITGWRAGQTVAIGASRNPRKP